MANLAGYIRSGRNLAPELDINLVRRNNTAYLHGWMYATASISKLASVGKAWMNACLRQVAGKYNLSAAGLYEASVLWGLRTRVSQNQGPLFGSPYSRDDITLGSTLGPPTH